MANPYIWTNNAMETGVADANPDIVNENLEHLYWYTDTIPTRDTSNMPIIANNTTDTDNALDISGGFCWDDTLTQKIILESTIIKKLDANWEAGSNQGGLDTGTKAINTWYFVFVIAKEDGTSDVLFSTSSTDPTMPENFIFKRRIGCIKTNGDGNIIPFIQDGDKFWWSTLIKDIHANTTITLRTLYTISVPPIKCYADIHIYTDAVQYGRMCLVTSPLQADAAAGEPCYNIFSITHSSGSKYFGGYYSSNILAVNSQIGLRSTHNASFKVYTMGWTDTRGRN